MLIGGLLTGESVIITALDGGGIMKFKGFLCILSPRDILLTKYGGNSLGCLLFIA